MSVPTQAFNDSPPVVPRERMPLRRIVLWVVTVLVLIYLFVPIIVVVVFSFNAGRSLGVFTGFSFRWYTALAHDDNVIASLKASLEVAIVTTVVGTLLGSMLAIGLGRMRSRLAGPANVLLLLPLVAPEIVTAIALLILFSETGQSLSLTTVMLGHITFSIAYVTIIVRGRLALINPADEEAAMDLGSTNIGAILRVVVPALRIDLAVVAPDGNRSAIGRGITTRRALAVERIAFGDGTFGYATDGTPVDCVRLASLGLVDGWAPELVVSGINHGSNLGGDVFYSGTVAAAREAAFRGVPAMALSMPSGADPALCAALAVPFVARLLAALAQTPGEATPLLNLNFPNGEPKGTRVAQVFQPSPLLLLSRCSGSASGTADRNPTSSGKHEPSGSSRSRGDSDSPRNSFVPHHPVDSKKAGSRDEPCPVAGHSV